MGKLSDLLDAGLSQTGSFAQGASNAAAGMVSGPVDVLSWGLRKVGVPVPENALGSSGWMESHGLTARPQNELAGMLGETAGMLSPTASSMYGSKIAAVLNQAGDSLAALRGLLQSENGAISTTYGSRSAKMRAPPQVNEAGFWNEYQGIKPGAASGERPMVDIDRRPIDPRSAIAGRRVVDGPSSGLSDEQVSSIVNQLGIDLRTVRAKEIGGDAGRYKSGGGVRSILLDNSLTAEQVPHVMRHELGHAVDDFAGAYTGPRKLPAIPPTGQTKALARVYDDMNNIHGPAPLDAPRPAKKQATPADARYPPAEHDAERMAEALRVYLTNPAYIKTAEPALAAMLRKAVNENPYLKQILTLNSAAGAGVLGYGASQDRMD